MPLPVFDTQDAIPEAFRAEYEEGEDKKWRPKAETEIAAEKKKRAKLLDEKKEADRLRAEAETERDDLKRAKDAREKGISEEELKKIRDAEAQARKPIEEERDKLKAENRKLKLTDRVQALYLKHGGMPDRVEDAMLVLDRRTELTDADGIAVKDKDGAVTSETIDDFLSKTFKKEKPWLYAGTGGSGGGSGGSSGNGNESVKPAADKEKLHAEKRAQVSAAL